MTTPMPLSNDATPPEPQSARAATAGSTSLNPNAASSDFDEEHPPEDGVGILVEMARKGQIDPWNVDIVQVADQFLKAVAEMKESDLQVTGKTLLYLAILLRMKSDKLAGINYLDPPDEFEEGFDPDFMETSLGVTPDFRHVRSLDELIKRRTSTKEHRIRSVTLNDLIVELQKYEELERKRSLREKVEKDDRRRQIRDYSDLTSDDIVELAHEEFLEDTILRLKGILERILVNEETISLTQLEQEGNIDQISAFLALLFLSARGEVNMYQEEFYSELYIGKDNGEATPIDPDLETLAEPVAKVAKKVNQK